MSWDSSDVDRPSWRTDTFSEQDVSTMTSRSTGRSAQELGSMHSRAARLVWRYLYCRQITPSTHYFRYLDDYSSTLVGWSDALGMRKTNSRGSYSLLERDETDSGGLMSPGRIRPFPTYFDVRSSKTGLVIIRLAW